jgi:hypothetical protein
LSFELTGLAGLYVAATQSSASEQVAILSVQFEEIRHVVPDPPFTPDASHYLEDTLVEATEFLLCGLATAQQAVSTLPKSPVTVMTLSMIHEKEAVRALLESAIAQVQLQRPRQVHTLH